jgi:hypothetical protein
MKFLGLLVIQHMNLQAVHITGSHLTITYSITVINIINHSLHSKSITLVLKNISSRPAFVTRTNTIPMSNSES